MRVLVFPFFCWVCFFLSSALYARMPLPTVTTMAEDGSKIVAHANDRVMIWSTQGKRITSFRSQTPLRPKITNTILVGVFKKGLMIRKGRAFKQKLLLKLPEPNAAELSPAKHHQKTSWEKILTIGHTAISADGRVVGAFFAKDGGSGDPNAFCLWETHRGKRIACHGLKKGRLHGLIISAKADYVAYFGDIQREKAIVGAFSLNRKKEILKPLFYIETKQADTAFSAAFDPQQKKLAAALGAYLLIWTIPDGKLYSMGNTSALRLVAKKRGLKFTVGAHQLAFSGDGKRLGTLFIYRVLGVGVWEIHEKKLKALRFLSRPPQSNILMRQLIAKGNDWLVLLSGRSPEVELYRSATDGSFQYEKTFN